MAGVETELGREVGFMAQRDGELGNNLCTVHSFLILSYELGLCAGLIVQ